MADPQQEQQLQSTDPTAPGYRATSGSQPDLPTYSQGAFDNQPSAQPQQKQGSPLKQALSRFFYGFGQGALRASGLPTDLDLQNHQMQMQQTAAQIQHTRAQTQAVGAMGQMIDTPLGPMSQAAWMKIAPSYISGQFRVEGVKLKNEGNLDATEMRTNSAESIAADRLTANANKPGPVDQQSLQDWMLKNPGKGPSDYVRWKASISPLGAAQSNQLPSNALDVAANLYLQTGSLPGGFTRSPQTTAAIIKRAAELSPDANIAGNKVAQKAYGTQAAKAQPQFVAFDTADQHLQLVEQAGRALQNGNVQALNKIANAYNVQAGKDPVTTFKALTTVAAPEIVRASAGSGQMSEKEIEVARNNFSPDLSPQQITQNVAAMRGLMAGKKASLQKNLGQLKGGSVTGNSGKSKAADPLGIR